MNAKTKEPLARLNFRLPNFLKQRLEEESSRKALPMSQIIRFSLEKYFESANETDK